MNAKALIPLVAGLGIGGLALKLGIDALRNARGATKPANSVQVWCATSNILRGTPITEERLKVRTLAAEMIPEGAITDKAKLLGRVSALDTQANMPIVETALLPAGENYRLRVKPGFRAVSVKIDEGSGVDFHLEPGCFVDVIGSFIVRRDGGRQETVATTIIEHAEVAAVGERIDPGTAREEPEAKGASRKVRAVTLFVRPEDAPKLHVTEQKGRIKLSLCADADMGKTQPGPLVTEMSLTGESEPPTAPAAAPVEATQRAMVVVPPQPPGPGWVVGIYRGNDPACEEVPFADANATMRMVPTAPPPKPVAPPPDAAAAAETEASSTEATTSNGGSNDLWKSLWTHLGQAETPQPVSPQTPAEAAEEDPAQSEPQPEERTE